MMLSRKLHSSVGIAVDMSARHARATGRFAFAAVIAVLFGSAALPLPAVAATTVAQAKVDDQATPPSTQTSDVDLYHAIRPSWWSDFVRSAFLSWDDPDVAVKLLRSAGDKGSLTPRDPGEWMRLFKDLPERRRDDVARALFAAKVAELRDEGSAMRWMNTLPLEARARIVHALRIQDQSAPVAQNATSAVFMHALRRLDDQPDLNQNILNAPLYEGMVSSWIEDSFKSDLDRLRSDPAFRAQLRKDLIRAVSADPGEPFLSAEINGSKLHLRTGALDEPLMNADYGLIDKLADAHPPSAADLERILLEPAESHFPGATVINIPPGLGNVAPRIWWLDAVGRRAPGVNLVLHYSWNDGRAESQLRRATDDAAFMEGVQLAEDQIRSSGLSPEEVNAALEAQREVLDRLYLNGTARHVFQDFRRSAAQLMKQAWAMRSDERLDLSNPVTIAHSQGNIDATLAELTFAALGVPKVLGDIYAFGPATSGSPVSDHNALVPLFGGLIGGVDAQKSIEGLSPDAVAQFLPVLGKALTRATFVSDLQAAPSDAPSGVNLGPALVIGDENNRFASGAGGGDGMVPATARWYVSDPANAYILSKKYDHFGVWSWDAMLEALPRIAELSSSDGRSQAVRALLAGGK
jgi:hypothetical protein